MDSSPHIGVHKHCKRHRTEILASERCGCFYCLAIFDPLEIPDWLDETSNKGGEIIPLEPTARCPRDRFGDRVGIWLSDHSGVLGGDEEPLVREAIVGTRLVFHICHCWNRGSTISPNRIPTYPGLDLSGYLSDRKIYPGAFHINSADTNELPLFYPCLD